ncbi:hypothetical protein [Hymenobacter sp. ISL-91]|uniref:hypothetical protein n=1 Tax=Hymenobacter sp. ISL-91 TaxID=2819151 RepID=UPI001BEC4937|nr:hypothetical protein [Hymenobacter sp. ISL-91]
MTIFKKYAVMFSVFIARSNHKNKNKGKCIFHTNILLLPFSFESKLSCSGSVAQEVRQPKIESFAI